MKRGKIIRTIIWIVVLLCCVGLGVWQRHNLSIFWKEYHALWRDYDYQEGSLVPRKPIIPDKIARSDPEAAAVADMILQSYYRKDEHLPALAENLMKFPDNEFFLFLCADKIFKSNELDQGVAVKLTEKLIDLDKENSLYHYLKAACLLAYWKSDEIAPALDEINAAANDPNFYFPYAKYTQRVVNTAERALLHPALVGMLSISLSYGPSVRQSSRFLLSYANKAFTDGEDEKGLLIDDAINSIGESQFDAGYNEAKLIMNNKNVYQMAPFGYWSSPEMLELQRGNITEQRARQNRIQLCPYVLPRIKSEETRDRKDSKGSEVTSELIIALLVAVHNGRMFFVIAGVWLVLVVICMVRGWSGNQRTGFTALLLFATASLCYFFVSNGLFYDAIREIRENSGMCNCGSVSHTDIMRPTLFSSVKIIDSAPIYLFLLLICPILAAVLLWVASRPRLREVSFWWRIMLKLTLTIAFSTITAALLIKFEHFEYGCIEADFLPKFVFFSIITLPVVVFASWIFKLRLVRVLLAAMPLGILTTLISPFVYISQIPLILFVVICTLIAINKLSEPVPFIKALTGIFSRQPESAIIRSKAVKLLALFIVIHWLLFAASVPTCSEYIGRLYPVFQWSYPKSNLVPADEMSYKRVLARFDSNDFELSDFRKLIPLVMPQDLPSVLNKCKNRSFGFSHPVSRPIQNLTDRGDGNSPLEQSSRKEIRLDDWNIVDVMQGCGRDVINILADTMDNPEQEFALVSRAQLGDVRIKAKLEQLLALRLANDEPPEPNKRRNYWDRPAKSIDIICALACISEPNEAGERFLDYVAKGDVLQLARDDKFQQGIKLLPTHQAREVIKAYLAKAQEWQPPEQVKSNGEKFREDVSMALWPMHGTAGTYADRDIAEAVLKIMLRSEEKDIIEDWDEPWEVPQNFNIQSADLLRQGLVSSKDQLRAWCVWQLRKVGYKFSEEEMSRLLADESWKVRANAVIAGGQKAAGRAAEDPNPFVRWVASLTANE